MATCPKCGRTLIGAGVCPSRDYVAPRPPSKPPVPVPSSYTPPTPSAYTPPEPVTYSPIPPAPATSAPIPFSSAPVPVPSSYAPSPAAAAPVASPPVALGGVRIRGSIDEVGAERFESVSMAAQNAMGNAAVGALTAIPRAIGVILGLLFTPLRMLLIPSLLSGGRRQNGPDSHQIPSTPFVLRGDDGTEYDCVLRGEVRGGFLKLGESVEVVGRIDRSRVVRVDEVRSLRTGAITKGWVDPRARRAKAQAIAGVVFLVFLLLFLISLFSALGSR